MSKHSKWAKVKNYKGVTDAKRAGVFTKLGRAITVAAKQGGDPAMNFQLRTAIDKAKEASMPKDTIERAVARGAGGGEGAAIEEVTYEGFGPGGAAILIRALTDNTNRTLQNVRTILSKKGGKEAGQNAVAWMFEQKGLLRVPTKGDTDDQTLALIDIGAEEVEPDPEGFTVSVHSERLEATKRAIEAAGMAVTYAETSLVPKETVAVTGEDAEKLAALVDALEEDEDVDEVVTNAEA